MRALYSLLILSALGATAWWGHHTGWTLWHTAPSDRTDRGEVEVLSGGRLRFGTGVALDFASAFRAPIDSTLAIPGAIVRDADRQARVASRAEGSVWRVMKRVGERVTAGEVLALIDAPDAGRDRAEFAQAWMQMGVRQTTLTGLQAAGGLAPPARLREAETQLRESRERLSLARRSLSSLGLPVDDLSTGLTAEALLRQVRFRGLPADLAARLERETNTACLIPIVAPIAGEVVVGDVVVGEVVEAARVLFVVADSSRLWLNLACKAEDSGKLRIGQEVRLGERTSKIERIATEADEHTRTVEVRVPLDNAGTLRVGARVTAKVVLVSSPSALLIPREAVRDGFVLVRDRAFNKGQRLLHLKTIRTGATDGDQIEVIDGLTEGDVVLARGAARWLDVARRAEPAGRP